MEHGARHFCVCVCDIFSLGVVVVEMYGGMENCLAKERKRRCGFWDGRMLCIGSSGGLLCENRKKILLCSVQGLKRRV